jgi:hypothetical protein
MMTKVLLWRKSIALAIALVLVAAVPTVNAFLDKRPLCERAASWVAAHASELPSDLDSLSELPIAYRRAAFAALSPQQKADLWRAQFAQRATDPAFTPEQQRFIARLQQATTAALFGNDEAANAARTAIAQEARAVMGNGEAKALVAMLGPEVALRPRSRLSMGVAASEWLRNAVTVAANGGGLPPVPCNCERGDDWCAPWPTSPTMSCVQASCVPGSGCGTFWGGPCDGECRP